MTDKELLELAAKAAGYSMKKHGPSSDGRRSALDNGFYWEPFDSDGDALRLAVKLGFRLDILQPDIICVDQKGHCTFQANLAHLDPYAATRRAIVRAAAEIGKEVLHAE